MSRVEKKMEQDALEKVIYTVFVPPGRFLCVAALSCGVGCSDDPGSAFSGPDVRDTTRSSAALSLEERVQHVSS